MEGRVRSSSENSSKRNTMDEKERSYENTIRTLEKKVKDLEEGRTGTGLSTSGHPENRAYLNRNYYEGRLAQYEPQKMVASRGARGNDQR